MSTRQPWPVTKDANGIYPNLKDVYSQIWIDVNSFSARTLPATLTYMDSGVVKTAGEIRASGSTKLFFPSQDMLYFAFNDDHINWEKEHFNISPLNGMMFYMSGWTVVGLPTPWNPVPRRSGFISPANELGANVGFITPHGWFIPLNPFNGQLPIAPRPGDWPASLPIVTNLVWTTNSEKIDPTFYSMLKVMPWPCFGQQFNTDPTQPVVPPFAGEDFVIDSLSGAIIGAIAVAGSSPAGDGQVYQFFYFKTDGNGKCLQDGSNGSTMTIPLTTAVTLQKEQPLSAISSLTTFYNHMNGAPIIPPGAGDDDPMDLDWPVTALSFVSMYIAYRVAIQ